MRHRLAIAIAAAALTPALSLISPVPAHAVDPAGGALCGTAFVSVYDSPQPYVVGAIEAGPYLAHVPNATLRCYFQGAPGLADVGDFTTPTLPGTSLIVGVHPFTTAAPPDPDAVQLCHRLKWSDVNGSHEIAACNAVQHVSVGAVHVWAMAPAIDLPL